MMLFSDLRGRKEKRKEDVRRGEKGGTWGKRRNRGLVEKEKGEER